MKKKFLALLTASCLLSAICATPVSAALIKPAEYPKMDIDFETTGDTLPTGIVQNQVVTGSTNLDYTVGTQGLYSDCGNQCAYFLINKISQGYARLELFANSSFPKGNYEYLLSYYLKCNSPYDIITNNGTRFDKSTLVVQLDVSYYIDDGDASTTDTATTWTSPQKDMWADGSSAAFWDAQYKWKKYTYTLGNLYDPTNLEVKLGDCAAWTDENIENVVITDVKIKSMQLRMIGNTPTSAGLTDHCYVCLDNLYLDIVDIDQSKTTAAVSENSFIVSDKLAGGAAVKVVLAEYSNDTRTLKNCEIQDITTAREGKTISPKTFVPTAGNLMKMFVWDSMGNIMPLTETVSYTVPSSL